MVEPHFHRLKDGPNESYLTAVSIHWEATTIARGQTYFGETSVAYALASDKLNRRPDHAFIRLLSTLDLRASDIVGI
jgi:hypothetical protein